MKTFADAIEAAEKVSTKKEKFNALSGIVPGHQRLIVEALNPYRVFHVKKWDDPKRYDGKDADMGLFYNMLDGLHDGKLTGDAARRTVSIVFSQYTKRTAKYLARVLKKDLDCGAQRKTFKAVYPKLRIPEFKVALAEKMDEKYKWKFPCIAEYKYDGLRLIAIVKTTDVTYLSRSGKPSDFCNGLFDDELMKMAVHLGGSIVVDGEVIGKTFQATAKAKGSKNTEHKNNLRYVAFDYMMLNEWTLKKPLHTQSSRTTKLRMMISALNLKKVVPSNFIHVDDIDEAKKFYKEALKEGFEGLIIKDMSALYNWKRSSNWTKWKPVNTYDLEIVEVLRGSGKYANTCGALMLKGEDENGRKIVTKMGSGLSDQRRDFFWAKKLKMIGKTIEVEAQEMTQAQNKDVWSLRFPVFVKIRNDK